MSTRYSPPGTGSSLWSMPIHRAIFPGSVKYEYTTSGLAAMCSSCVNGAASSGSGMLRLLLGRRLEAGQVLGPELLDEGPGVSERLGTGAVEPPVPVSSLGHEACLPEDRQVLRDRRPAHIEVRRDLAGGEL